MGICFDAVGSAKLLLGLDSGVIIKGVTVFDMLQVLQRNIEKREQETVKQLRDVVLIPAVQLKQPFAQRFI